MGASESRIVSYDIAIDSVRRDGDTTGLGPKRLFTGDTSGVYRDSLMVGIFQLSGGTVMTSIRNQSGQSIELKPEEGAFVLPLGTTSRIIRGNMSYASRSQPVQPITVPAGAAASAKLIPESNVRMGEYDVRVDALFPPQFVGGGAAAAQVASTGSRQDVQENIGRSFQMLLPVAVEDRTVEYTFYFEVSGAQIGSDDDPNQETIGDYSP